MTAIGSSIDERLAPLFASDPAALADPFSIFNALREQTPVYEFESRWLVLRHADVKELIADHFAGFSRSQVLFSARATRARARLTAEQQDAYDNVAALEGLKLSATDPPQHTRLRQIAHRMFTPRRIAALEQSIQRFTDDLLAPLAAGDEVVDLTTLSFRLPLMVIADLLEIPQTDADMIHGWTEKLARNKGGTIDPGPLLDASAAAHDFRAYVNAAIEEKRRSGDKGELVTALLDAAEGDRLTADELTSMFVVLLFGGHETTTNLLGNGLVELLRHRDQWELLCADPGLAAKATEELLRFVTPVQWLQRVALEDREVAGTRIHAGDSVLAVLASANRDPAVFAEPDRLDILRDDVSRNLGLGFGPYFCLGASLARMEGRVAFATLSSRFPGIELATDRLEWKGSALLRGLASLPVRLGPERG